MLLKSEAIPVGVLRIPRTPYVRLSDIFERAVVTLDICQIKYRFNLWKEAVTVPRTAGAEFGSHADAVRKRRKQRDRPRGVSACKLEQYRICRIRGRERRDML